MWFWPVNEMAELVSGMPAPQFGDESSFLCFVLIDVRCLLVPLVVCVSRLKTNASAEPIASIFSKNTVAFLILR
jgi:hypothetical protein